MRGQSIRRSRNICSRPSFAARLMGADCVISGIRPQIAQTIVALGVEFGDIITKSSLADALKLTLKRAGLEVRNHHRTPPVTDRVPIIKIGDVLMVSNSSRPQRRGRRSRCKKTSRIKSSRRERTASSSRSPALEIVDTFIGRMLATIASVSRVLDAETVVVGMRPAGRDHPRRTRALARRLCARRSIAERAFDMLRESMADPNDDADDDDDRAEGSAATDSLSTRRRLE